VIECYVTDRHTLEGEALLEAIARNLVARVTWIQIREKDLEAKALYELVVAALQLPNPNGTKFIVNSRVDVAVAAGADGVHLPASSPEWAKWNRLLPPRMLRGVSCHTIEEVAAARGASYVLFGPVFAPLSKRSAIARHGVDGLRRASAVGSAPVVALGGVTRANAGTCVEAGAVGIAGITLFQRR
jgi:thiamine-phosphate pyrophosphorylase